MDSNRLWSPAFTNYGISSGILYMTQDVYKRQIQLIVERKMDF